MTSKLQIPKISKEIKMGIKGLVGRKITKSVKFMGEDVKIAKLTISQVTEIQDSAKNLKEDDSQSFDVLQKIIKLAVEDALELTSEDFQQLPLDELAKLSNEIMTFSGLNTEKGK